MALDLELETQARRSPRPWQDHKVEGKAAPLGLAGPGILAKAVELFQILHRMPPPYAARSASSLLHRVRALLNGLNLPPGEHFDQGLEAARPQLDACNS